MIYSYFFLFIILFNGDIMFKIGDIVTRNSYNNDTIFRITNIEDEIYYLTGINVRLCADAEESDLKIYDEDIDRDEDFLNKIKKDELNRNDYFYLPGKILHIDSDKEYLNRCLKYYNDYNIMAAGILEKEENIPIKISELLNEYNPDIVVITGHDSFNKKGKEKDIKSYRNSIYFKKAVEEARKYEKSHEKLVIIAGGCQSDYEELIKAGANFASSPKRVNIHALDPAIVATKMSLSDIARDIDIKDILEDTKYGSNGIGGIITKGTMHIGYPR